MLKFSVSTNLAWFRANISNISNFKGASEFNASIHLVEFQLVIPNPSNTFK